MGRSSSRKERPIIQQPAVSIIQRFANSIIQQPASSMIQRPVSLSTSCVPHADAALFDSFARAGVACAEISMPGRLYADFP